MDVLVFLPQSMMRKGTSPGRLVFLDKTWVHLIPITIYNLPDENRWIFSPGKGHSRGARCELIPIPKLKEPRDALSV
jgi:hypothetical protein